MPKTDIVVELDAQYPEDKHLCDQVLSGLNIMFEQTCSDLDCIIRSVPQTEIHPDVGRTVALAISQAKRALEHPETMTCMYVATRTLIVPWKQRRTYELVAYVMATANKRSVLNASIATRSEELPAEVAEEVRRQLLPVVQEKKLFPEELTIVKRLQEAFSLGLDLAQELATRKPGLLQ